MKARYDLSKAAAVVNEYAAALADPNQLTGRLNRTWIEARLERHGVIPDVRGLSFGESHALWYACLVTTGRVQEISRLEKACGIRTPTTTQTAIRRCLSPKYSPTRDTVSARLLREILTEAGWTGGKP